MNRRTFLTRLAGGVAGVVVGGRLAGPPLASAQTTAAPGVGPKEVKFGMSAAFSGASASLGTEYYRGAQAYFAEVNALGGVNGRKFTLVAKDDAYDPDRTVENTVALVDAEVFCLFNYVGTPTLSKALPIIRGLDADDLVLVGNLTGAQIQRQEPYVGQVYNVRASYYQEMQAVVDGLWGQGLRKLGVFYQIDAYGRSGTDGVVRALAGYDEKVVAEATYRRGANFEDDMSIAVEHLRAAGAEAVLTTGSYAASAAFIRTARNLGWRVPITNLSFVGSEAMLNLLQTAEAASGQDYTSNLVISQVVPAIYSDALPAVREYRRLSDKHKPTLPEGVGGAETTGGGNYSFTALEGFVNAKVLVQAVRLAGPQLSRQAFRRTLDTLSTDVGLDAPIRFGGAGRAGRTLHQGFDTVYLTTVREGRWVPLSDWSAVTQGT